jgi:hypothetical protein
MAWTFNTLLESVWLRRIGVAASIVIHVLVLAWLIFGADVKLFAPSQPDVITVELVSPEEAEPKKKDEDKPQDPFQLPDIKLTDSTPPPAPAAAAAPAPPPPPPPPAAPNTNAASQPPAPDSAQSLSASDMAAQMPATFGAPVAAPDVTDQYGTLFQMPDPGYDAVQSQAKLTSDVVTRFREHLKTCSVRPAGLAPSDQVRLVLRVALLRDGKLAAPPALIEAKASPKGPILMQAAMKALQSCQPYSMLPADKYNEWKVLDIDFTPADFNAP